MALEDIADKVIDTDVLVIGGGIAGCCAAAKARDHGLNVTLIDKAAVERSGSAAQGIDHFDGLFPRDGMTTLDIVKGHERRGKAYHGGNFQNLNLVYKLADQAFWVFDELEKLGVTMRWDDGEPYWIPYANFGLPVKRISLRVHWQNVKPQLAAAVKKRGTNILERIMVVDLLTNEGAVVGATAVNTRTGEFIVIKSKATVVATGYFQRLYDPETPVPGKHKMRYHFCPSSISGDGWAAAYRAGAVMANMDITGWTFRIRDDLAISFGNFRLNEGVPMKSLTWKGEEIINPTPKTYFELEQKGQTPIYFSLEHLPDDFHKRIERAYVDERPISFKIAEDMGFNPKKHRYELNAKPLGFMHWSGINVDEDCKTSLQGLYAIGDCAASLGSVSFATSSGLLVGNNIHKRVEEAGEPEVNEGQAENQKKTAMAPLNIKDGAEPSEFEAAIRYICERYISNFKSEGKLLEGMRRLGTLRKVWLPKLTAKGPHHLMRCLENRNILDLAKVHMEACLERKETRAEFIRLDYPEENPSMGNKVIFQRLEDEKAVLEIGEMPKLKPELEEEK
jgi:succinate dehydrogenase/fumarate reductase flavoprotein subunit